MSRSSLRGRAAVTSATCAALGALVAGGLTALPAQAAPTAKSSPSQLGAAHHHR